ncbi:MAG: hypothetical protein R2856_16900 [Caldilineaceae bacterium]
MKGLLRLFALLILVVAVTACVQVAPAPPLVIRAAPVRRRRTRRRLLAEIMERLHPHLHRSQLRAAVVPQFRWRIRRFDVDVAKEIASRLGVEVEFVTPDWDLITA